MNINDPIGDMITRIRNAHLRGKDSVDSPSSNLRINIFLYQLAFLTPGTLTFEASSLRAILDKPNFL